MTRTTTMMLDVKLSGRFRRDLRTAARRGLNLELLEEVVNTLADQKPLSEKYRDHELTGKYTGCRECHIAPDWLLVYQVQKKELMLYLMRTGSHSDIF